MNIQFCSDLHLEFLQNREFIRNNPLQPEGDILLLAGDILPLATLNQYNDFLDYVSDNFLYTYWLPGNHEYYGFDLYEKGGSLNEKIRSNVFLVNNVTIEHDNLRIIFSTLWTEIDPLNRWHIEIGINDFRLIKYHGNGFSSHIYNALHEASIAFIKHELVKYWDGKTIVVTHHVPTFKNFPKEYQGSILNQAFAVELFDFIETSRIDYWIYGHHHRNVPCFTIGQTRLLTNQLGYVSQNEHVGFNNSDVINI